MRTLVFFTALLLGTNEERIWELQSITQSKAVFIWIIYWLKPGLKKSIPSWLLKSLSVLFVVRMKQLCRKSGALNLIPSKTVYSAFCLPYSWHLKLYSWFFCFVFISAATDESWNCTLQQGLQYTLKNRLPTMLPAQTKHLSAWAPPRWSTSAPEWPGFLWETKRQGFESLRANRPRSGALI